MILSSIILFSLAATLGFGLVVLGVRYKRSSLKVGLIHAGSAITALGLLLMHVFNSDTNKYNNVAVLLMIAALIGGLMLLGLRVPGKPPAMMLVGLHAFMALVGLSLLLLGFEY